jgi:hypothetical protein
VKTRFSAGGRVRVSDEFFWAKGATGTITVPPNEVTAISGKWHGALTRREVSALGTNTVYWVWFDEPHTTQKEMARIAAVKFGRVPLRYSQHDRTGPRGPFQLV